MYRILDIDQQAVLDSSTDTLEVRRPVEGHRRWIDLCEQDEAQLSLLAEHFPFHPLTIEDCLHFDQRPKFEGYGSYLFLVLHGFRPLIDGVDNTDPFELHIFLTREYLVTVHSESIPALDSVWQRVTADPQKTLGRGADFVCYLLADSLIDAYFPVLDQIGLKVDEIEERVLDAHQAVQLAEIFYYKRLLVALRKVLSPQRDVLLHLTKRADGWIEERTALYFRDVYDHLLVLNESVETTRDLLGNALDAYLWASSQRTNEIMKRLTLVSAIFLPLTFITGFFGQNFANLPFADNRYLYLMLVSCVAIPLGMFFYFKRSRWF
jgi:magnesium transporter